MQAWPRVDQFGRGPYLPRSYDICPGGYNRQSFYACSSASPRDGYIDHFIISDASLGPESIDNLNWLGASGQISEHEYTARTAHIQNLQVVQQQMHQYQAYQMATQQYWALQQQLWEQQMAAARSYYRAQPTSTSMPTPASSQGSKRLHKKQHASSTIATAGSSVRSAPQQSAHHGQSNSGNQFERWSQQSNAGTGSSGRSQASTSAPATTSTGERWTWQGIPIADQWYIEPTPPPKGAWNKFKRSFNEFRYGVHT